MLEIFSWQHTRIVAWCPKSTWNIWWVSPTVLDLHEKHSKANRWDLKHLFLDVDSNFWRKIDLARGEKIFIVNQHVSPIIPKLKDVSTAIRSAKSTCRERVGAICKFFSHRFTNIKIENQTNWKFHFDFQRFVQSPLFLAWYCALLHHLCVLHDTKACQLSVSDIFSC